MDVEAEIRDLKRRVGEFEGSFGFLTAQVRDVHRSVLGFQENADERFTGIEGRLDRVDGRLDRVEQKVDGLDRKVSGLDAKVDGLPRSLAEVVRSEFDRRDRGT